MIKLPTSNNTIKFMGLSFQHRVTLFPGVRINFSGGGITTTLGVPGASVKVGPKGNYLNLGIPGSGLSYRTPLDVSPHQPRLRQPREGYTPEPAMRPLLPGEGEIKSRDVSELTSPGLEKLKELINAAALQKVDAAHKLEQAQHTLKSAEFKLGVAKAFIVRLFLGRVVPRLHRAVIEKTEESDVCRSVLDASHINIDFAFDGETSRTWAAVVEAFGKLRGSERIWDVTASYYTNMAAERTNAARAITRVPSRFDTVSTDVISTYLPALRFVKANGQHVHIYPGFAMMQSRSGDFALIDLLELSISCTYTSFHEEEGVPADAVICGQTWKRANKDGGPDRRFSNNYRIPIARYGEIDMASPTGIKERYMVSNHEAVLAFGNCYETHVRALRTMSTCNPAVDRSLQAPKHDDVAVLAEDDVVQSAPNTRSDVMSAPSFRSLVMDMVVLLALAAGGWYYVHSRAVELTSPKSSKTAEQSAAPSHFPAEGK